jgi:hypothetical protein
MAHLVELNTYMFCTNDCAKSMNFHFVICRHLNLMTSTFSISEFINKSSLRLRDVDISCLLICNYLGWQYCSITHSAVESRDRSAAVSAELWCAGWTGADDSCSLLCYFQLLIAAVTRAYVTVSWFLLKYCLITI